MSVSLLALQLALLFLATFRVTRFVTRDKFPLVCAPREAFVRRWGAYEDTPRAPAVARLDADGHPRRRNVVVRAFRWLFASEFESVDARYRTNMFMKSLAYLWECDWCASAWVGAGLTYATWRWSTTMLWVTAALAASAVTGLLAQREPKDD